MPSPADFAAAERAYADACRRDADTVAPYDEQEAATLRLEADVCEMWAAEIEGTDQFNADMYDSALEEYRAVLSGQEPPRGGILYLVQPATETSLAH